MVHRNAIYYNILLIKNTQVLRLGGKGSIRFVHKYPTMTVICKIIKNNKCEVYVVIALLVVG